MIFICFILTLLISIFIQTHGQVTCASGWVTYEGNCYQFSSMITWDQCNAYCPTSYPGATMLCVNKQAESAWIKSLSNNAIWIGYTDMPPYGGGKGTKQYRWITGCSSTYTNWNAGEPNNAGGEDCTIINDAGRWDDRSCQSSMQCACQYTPVLTKAPTYSPSTVAPTTSSPTTVAPTTSSPTTVAPTTSSPTTVAPTTSSPSTVAPTTSSPSKTTPSTTVPSRDGAFTCHWKFYSSQPGSGFQQDSLMTSSETVPEFDYFYHVLFAGLALGSLLTLLIQASLYCCTRKAYAVAIADRSEYFPIIGRE
jgi:hypothetical protein